MSSSLPPFGVKVDHPRSCDLIVQGIPGCRLRSRITASRMTVVNKDAPDGEQVIPPDQSRHLGILPEIPGMELHVNPGKQTYKIIDPLHNNEKILNRLKRGLEQDERPVRGTKYNGLPPQEGTLDQHRMKTLCREMVQWLEVGFVVMAKGPKPSLEDVGELPGKYLLNPGATIPNSQPRFEEDLEAYVLAVNQVR